MGRKIGEAEEIRHASDYDDFYIASREESERQVAVADEFIQLTEKYCMTQFEVFKVEDSVINGKAQIKESQNLEESSDPESQNQPLKSLVLWMVRGSTLVLKRVRTIWTR